MTDLGRTVVRRDLIIAMPEQRFAVFERHGGRAQAMTEGVPQVMSTQVR
jgi:hypothetical protein